MGLFTGFLFFVLALNCLFLMLLVLVQLPKKEAGAGTAFGAGTTDALFGAGTGNALTKLTKYSAGIFLGLSFLLSVLVVGQSKKATTGVTDLLKKQAGASQAPVVIPTNAVEQIGQAPSNSLLVVPPTAAPATPAK